MKKFALVALGALCWANAAVASVVSVKVVGANGKPVAGAVVTLKPVGHAAPAPRISGPFRVEQRNMQFNPFISVVPVNADVYFPNYDPTMHHVYSFSPAKVFELKLIARNQSRGVKMERAGIVAVGCNIHDSMSAYIFVTDTAWTARTNANGEAVFRDAPDQATTASVWHPFMRTPGGSMSRAFRPGGAHSETFSVKLRPSPLRGMGNY